MTVLTLLEDSPRGISRGKAAFLSGMCDRDVRREIRRLRREGVPVMALPDGGYKLAHTAEEKAQLLRQYRSRAIDQLITYRKLAKAMQMDGQMSIEDVLRGADGGI